MARGSYKVNPDSLRQRLLAHIPFEGSRSSTDILNAAGIVGKERANACSALDDLKDHAFVEIVGYGEKSGCVSKAPRLFRRLPDEQVYARRKFQRAKKIVEAAGFVVIPKRPLPTLAANSPSHSEEAAA